MSTSTPRLLALEPVFQNKIWGGRSLESAFGYPIPEGPVGECWGISAHPHGDCTVLTEPFAGCKLSELWNEHREIFGGVEGDRFPLLIKIIDAEDDLSVQVHPGDAYAAEHEGGSLGKTECWYVIDCAEGATIIVGQKTASREEMAAAIESGAWDEVLNELPIHPGDFFQIDAGTVHAIKGGTLVLETQQSSDITYRLYDYDRRQDDGTLRELHIDKALDVIDYAKPSPESGAITAEETDGVTMLERCDAYTVCRLHVAGVLSFPLASAGIPFACVSVIEGEGAICGEPVRAGSHLIATAACDALEAEGTMTLMVSYL